MRKAALIASAALAASALAACSTVKETIRGPELAPMGYPAALTPQTLAIVPQPVPQPASPNSLWRAGASTFFADQRARRVGDILTVKIEIDDRAQMSNSTNRSRSNSVEAGVPNFFGLESSIARVMPQAFDPSKMIGMNGEQTSNGTGVIARSERVSLTVAAVVTGVLPNGNLVIQGRQEVRTNAEVRELTIAGIVAPNDISSANTIDHTQIAEARISYGGRGDVTRVQRPPLGQRVVERFSPF